MKLGVRWVHLTKDTVWSSWVWVEKEVIQMIVLISFSLRIFNISPFLLSVQPPFFVSPKQTEATRRNVFQLPHDEPARCWHFLTPLSRRRKCPVHPVPPHAPPHTLHSGPPTCNLLKSFQPVFTPFSLESSTCLLLLDYSHQHNPLASCISSLKSPPPDTLSFVHFSS